MGTESCGMSSAFFVRGNVVLWRTVIGWEPARRSRLEVLSGNVPFG